MTRPARPDPARTTCRNDHVRPGPAPSGAVRPARRAVGTLARHIGTRAQPGRPAELPLAGTTRRHVRRLASSATWPLRPRGLVPGWTVVSGLSPVLVTGGWLVADADPAGLLQPDPEDGQRDGWPRRNRSVDHDGGLDPGGRVSARDCRGPDRRPGACPHPARRRGPVQHRHRPISRARSRLYSAAPRLDFARRGGNRGVACLRRQARATAAADPGQLRLCRRDCRVHCPARLACHRNPGRQ